MTEKAYNIVMTGVNDATVDLYGEVVEARPIDYFTGEPVEGQFIILKDFLADLDQLSTKDNVTFRINSVGGDLYAGISIYNRIKALSGKVVTINDGLAASAASIIFQAGNVRKMHVGSNLMVHQAMGLLYGYYQAKDLEPVINQLKAHDKAIVNVYAEASGRDAKEMQKLVNAETWLTGQEAVDAGLADEVITDDKEVTMSITNDAKHLVVNGRYLPTRGMHNIPAGLPVEPENETWSNAAPAADDKNFNERDDQMEIKNLTDLKNAYPELMEQARAEAFDAGKAEGAADERARLQEIEAIAKNIPDEQLVRDAMYGDTPLNAEQLAYKAMQELDFTKATALQNLAADTIDSGVNGVNATPVQTTEPSAAELQANAEKEALEAVKNVLYSKGVR